MPRDSSGIYTLPDGYQAVTGETIQPAQHNSPLEDIAAALTGSLPRNGSAPMLSPIRLTDGTVAAPALTFNSATTTGLYKTTNGIGFVVGGVLAGEMGTGGFISGAPIGGGMEFWGDTAPPSWIFAYGQTLSRTTYASLFAVFGTKYGAGDGSTTFGIPDKRDRASFGKGDMGGTPANRITNQPGGWEGDTLGAAGGEQTQTLSQAQLPAIAPTGSVTASINNITAIIAIGSTTAAPGVGSAAAGPVTASIPVTFGSPLTFTGNVLGSSTPHNNLPPGIVCNYIIFAGA